MIIKLLVTTSILFSFLVSKNNNSDSIKLKVFEISDSTITNGKKFKTIQPGVIEQGREIKFDNANLAPQNVRVIFNDFFKKYIAVKEALVYKDSYGAGSKTLTLLEQMKSKSDEVNKDIKDARWDIFMHNYENIIKKVKDNKFIAEQRFTFSEVSRGLENFIKQYGLYDKTIDYSISVNFENTYGNEFGFLNSETPASVFLAEGSEIEVKEGRKI